MTSHALLRTRAITLALVCITSVAQGTQVQLAIVRQPLHVHLSGDPEIAVADVPVVFAGSMYESVVGAVFLPFVPPHDSSWNHPRDVNLASLYGIKGQLRHDREHRAGAYVAVIDASGAEAPEGYRFEVEEVADAVIECVRVTMRRHLPADAIGFIELALGEPGSPRRYSVLDPGPAGGGHAPDR